MEVATSESWWAEELLSPDLSDSTGELDEGYNCHDPVSRPKNPLRTADVFVQLFHSKLDNSRTISRILDNSRTFSSILDNSRTISSKTNRVKQAEK